MPAIDLTRLRARFKLLEETIENPGEFTRGLRELFLFHADFTQTAGNSSSGGGTMPKFNSPALLNREVVLALSPYCNEKPALILPIIDCLWQEREVELRELAAQLLGRMPQNTFDEVVHRIQTWSLEKNDAEILPLLHQTASAQIRRDAPNRWLDVLNTWNSSSEPWLAKLAINGTIPLIDDRAFENLPAIFTFISPLILTPTYENQYELLNVIEHLAQRSEVETVYFLKQVMSLSTDPGMGRFMRRAIELFSAEMQESLRSAMRLR